jgi:predicted nucleotidyltransferase component of viral defense system
MGSLNYKKLYKLQDEVLDTIFKTEQIFYLTGGTCLSRFYYEKRYSDDLDLFTHDDRQYSRALKEIELSLKEKFDIKNEVTSRDFTRIMINDLLQVDFVNDRVTRYKEPIYLDNGYIIDNLENILANKITAVIGRDNPKDIFDIFLIDKFNTIDWKTILSIAHEKAGFSDDDLIIRLKTFPYGMLNKIVLFDLSFLDDFKERYKKIIEKIEQSLS